MKVPHWIPFWQAEGNGSCLPKSQIMVALKPDNVENKDDGTGAKQEGSKQGITESGNKESENSRVGDVQDPEM